MSEEKKSESMKQENTTESLAEQLQAGHRSRMNGNLQQGLNMNNIQFYEVTPDAAYQMQTTNDTCMNVSDMADRIAESTISDAMPESYLNYAAQLLEQMRSVYSSSWDSCANGGTWHGGHNHFYNPCSGADVPPSHSCPVYDCTNTCGCMNPSPQPAPYPPMHDQTCNGGTATYYDDCAYKLQKISDQLNRIETMTNEMYNMNQQLFSYLIEYYNAIIANGKSK